MPAVAQALGALIQQKVAANFQKLGGHPLDQKNPSYFIAFCLAVGKGIADGTPTISFRTVDTGVAGAPPIPGVGTGVGIKVDSEYMSQKMYEAARTSIKSKLGKTLHEAWPPPKGNTGEWLKALTDGIAEAVKEHYQISWILTSTHPIVYAGSGKIVNGGFFGVQEPRVATTIQVAAPVMKGSYWPDLCQAIAKGYTDGIHNRSTGTVTIAGICVPSPGQACGLPLPGAGTGAAS